MPPPGAARDPPRGARGLQSGVEAGSPGCEATPGLGRYGIPPRGGLKTATACAPSLEHGRFPPAFTAPKSSTSVRVILKAAGFTNDAPEAIDLAKAAIFHPELGPKSTPTGSATNFIVVKVKRDFSR